MPPPALPSGGGAYDGPANDYDYATALAISPDGARLFVTGTSTGSGTRRDYTTIAYDTSSGADLWTTRFAGPFDGDDVAEAIAVSPDGSKVFVAGFGPTIAYDASNGTQLWNKVYNALFEVRSLAMSPDGSTLIAAGAYAEVNTPLDMATFAFEAATGAKVWARHVDGPGSGEDFAFSAATSSDGADVFVTGRSAGTTTGLDYLTIAYAI
jgi:WD40 repeat protein